MAPYNAGKSAKALISARILNIERLLGAVTRLIADGQTVTSFGTPASQDLPPVLCRHAKTEAVFVAPLASAGLVGAFHGLISCRFSSFL